jgi:hypothetical protein
MRANSHHHFRSLGHAPIMTPADGMSTDAQQNRRDDVAHDSRVPIDTATDSAAARIRLLMNWPGRLSAAESGAVQSVRGATVRAAGGRLGIRRDGSGRCQLVERDLLQFVDLVAREAQLHP